MDYRKLLSDFKLNSAYLKWTDELERRETWDEACERVFDMHKFKFKSVYENNFLFKQYFDYSLKAYKSKHFLASMRSLQFGGASILKHNGRMFNCLSGYCDRPIFFQECMYWLLCGCGVGFSIQNKHVNRLPKIQRRSKRTKTFVIPDTIEGWSDAVGVLMSSYLTGEVPFPEYQGRTIHFDFSLIRPVGAYISGGFKSAGSDGLRDALIKMENLMESELKSESPTKVRSIIAYDLVMFMSDAVLSGGVRRSATICLFSPDDEEMLKAKTGNWFATNPQRARSNNSVVLIRDETTKEQFAEIMKSVKDWGEPAFVWSEDADIIYNPCVEIGMYPRTIAGKSGWQGCVSYDTKMITKNGLETIGEVVDNDGELEIWNGHDWKKVKPFQTGKNRSLYRVTFSDGSYLDCTENHKFMVKNRFEQEYRTVTTTELVVLLGTSKYHVHTPSTTVNYDSGTVINNAYDYGFVLGDGCVDKKKIVAEIYDGSGKEHISFSSNVNLMRERFNKNLVPYSVYSFDDLNTDFVSEMKYNIGLPKNIFSWSRKNILEFIAGWADADGTNASNGIRVYSDESKVRDLQLLLRKVGIKSSVNLMAKENTNTSKLVKNRNTSIWYVQITKTIDIPCQRLTCNYKSEPKNKGKNQNIKSIEVLDGLHNSYCLEEPETHNCLFGNVLTKQCNLVEINGSDCKTEEEFYERCKVAAFVGTLQAAYTDFKYVDPISKEIFDREALLGTSITGMMNNPYICFDKEIQRKGAEIVKAVNKEVAAMIGINQAARTTCVKPSGNASVTLGCASGIHGEHSKRYFRNVQMNKDDDVAKYFVERNPSATEESVWSTNNTDWVISFPITSNEDSVFKKDLLGIKQLEYVKLTQQNWVESGTNKELCVHPQTRHNVSNTISVDDWDSVGEFIYDNRYWLAGVSLLSFTGDRDFAQAPFTAVYTPEEILEMYGDATIFASGLIVDGLQAFYNNLWAACDQIQGMGKFNLEQKTSYNALMRDWIRRAEQFTERYFDGDTKKMTYCLKDVYNYHKWVEISREMTDIDWTANNIKPEFISVDTLGAIACSGGKCELTF